MSDVKQLPGSRQIMRAGKLPPTSNCSSTMRQRNNELNQQLNGRKVKLQAWQCRSSGLSAYLLLDNCIAMRTSLFVRQQLCSAFVGMTLSRQALLCVFFIFFFFQTRAPQRVQYGNGSSLRATEALQRNHQNKQARNNGSSNT